VIFKRKQFFTSDGVPHFASSVVRTSDEFISRLVESTVSEREEMSPQYLKQLELLFLIFHLFLNQLLDELFQLGTP
jgi:hypothetical protein